MSQRIPRVNHLIKEEIGKLLSKEVEFPKGVLVTVTRVETAPNLSQVKVYLSCLPKDRAREALHILGGKIFPLQKKLDKLLAMRPVPKLIFVSDEEAAKAARVEEILERLKNETA